MSDFGKETASLLVATFGSCAIVRVKGRGSFKTSPALKQFCNAMLDKGCDQLVLDMEECMNIDSTFMGVLAGIALRLRQMAKNRIMMVNVNEKAAELLRTLGLDRMILMDPADDAARKCRELALRIDETCCLDTGEVDKGTATRTVLEAHEDLVRVSPANLPKFQDVLAYLNKTGK